MHMTGKRDKGSRAASLLTFFAMSCRCPEMRVARLFEVDLADPRIHLSGLPA